MAFAPFPKLSPHCPETKRNSVAKWTSDFASASQSEPSEDKLIGYLVSANFVPDWRRRNEANASLFIWNGLLCDKIIHVLWRADAAGILTMVSGAYESHCL
jgi:hypothetical protein